MTSTADCRVTNFNGDSCAAWWAGPDGRTLKAEMQPGMGIVIHLGVIKRKNDGRWWWSFKRDKHGIFTPPTEPVVVQGVAATQAEAKAKVQQLWGAK